MADLATTNGAPIDVQRVCTVRGVPLPPPPTKHRRKTCSNSCRALLRKQGIDRRCVDCGVQIGPDHRRCRPCGMRFRREEAKRSHLAAAHTFARRYGRPPTATDWNPALALLKGQNERAEAFDRAGDYPPTSAVQRIWGSWTAFITAAGFTPLPQGRPQARPRL